MKFLMIYGNAVYDVYDIDNLNIEGKSNEDILKSILFKMYRATIPPTRKLYIKDNLAVSVYVSHTVFILSNSPWYDIYLQLHTNKRYNLKYEERLINEIIEFIPQCIADSLMATTSEVTRKSKKI